MSHISNTISPTDFILGTKVQPNKAHSMPQKPMTLTQGQGQRSRSNFFSKMGKKTKNWSYLGGYFTYRFHTWYQGTTQQGKFYDPSADDLDLWTRKGQGQRSRSNFHKNGVKIQRTGQFIIKLLTKQQCFLSPLHFPLHVPRFDITQVIFCQSNITTIASC